MENVLLTITAASVALSAGLAIALARVMREDRHRSDARVALLRDLSAQAGGPSRLAPVRPASPAPADSLRRPSPPSPIPAQLRTGPVPDLEIRPAMGVAGVGELFHAPERPSPWRWRAVAIAGMAAVLLVGVSVARLRAPAEPPVVRTAAPPAVVTARPLELLSLNHSRREDTLTITGLVQNPRGAAPLVNVTATALLLGAGGAVLTSGRAALDFSTVGPGEESPFVITVPVMGNVERYRIAFRGGDGQVLAHVDRRGPDAVARK
jgi:hypothetical protein